ncbi:MAG: AAA family ATPase [Proteobacteria bacterium]|nr:AAA family ATPase [Pseudomonadota bacterium]
MQTFRPSGSSLKTLAVISSKGGSGKTTLSLHLAVAAEAAGRRTFIADTDPQKSAWEWRQVRSSPAPEVAVVQPAMLNRLKDGLERARFQLMIVDTAPFAGPGVLDTVRAADFTIIVARPSMLDLWSVEYSAEQVRSARGRAMFVLTQAPPRRGDKEAPALLKAAERLNTYGFPVASIGLRSRVAFSQSVGNGLTALETEPSGTAAREISRLAELVFGRLWPDSVPRNP